MIGGKERMEQKRKKRFGDRRDGYKVDVPSLQKVMGYILPKRTDCEVFMMDSFDCTEVMKYLELPPATFPVVNIITTTMIMVTPKSAGLSTIILTVTLTMVIAEFISCGRLCDTICLRVSISLV